MTRSEKIEAQLEQEDERFVQAALDSEKCLAQIHRLSKLRRSHLKSMMVMLIFGLAVGVLHIVDPFVSKNPSSPNFAFATIAFSYISFRGSYDVADMKIKMLKAMLAVRA